MLPKLVFTDADILIPDYCITACSIWTTLNWIFQASKRQNALPCRYKTMKAGKSGIVGLIPFLSYRVVSRLTKELCSGLQLRIRRLALTPAWIIPCALAAA
jgi:hypothetical protein